MPQGRRIGNFFVGMTQRKGRFFCPSSDNGLMKMGDLSTGFSPGARVFHGRLTLNLSHICEALGSFALRFLTLTMVVWLSGCGLVYHAPSVPLDDPNVTVVDMNTSSIRDANASKYRPKALPAVFHQTTPAPNVSARQASLPTPPVQAEPRPNFDLPMRLPPQLQPRPYEIGIGDVVVIATQSGGTTVEELSGLLAAQNRRQGYTVQDDGAIAVPNVGRIQVAGLTIEEAEAEVFQSLVRNGVDPTFSIEIAEFNSKKVAVGGNVTNPTIIAITLTGLTLEEAITKAGGFSVNDPQFASIRIYRDGTLYQIPLQEYQNRSSIRKLRLKDEDSIFVDTIYELDRAQDYFEQQITINQARANARAQSLAELRAEMEMRRSQLNEKRQNFQARLELGAVDRDYVYVVGEVSQATRVPLPFEQKAVLADVLFGETNVDFRTANPAEIYVLRGVKGSDQVVAYKLDARNATKLVLATQMELRPNDIIFVAQQPVTKWNRVVTQITPGLINTGIAAVSN